MVSLNRIVRLPFYPEDDTAALIYAASLQEERDVSGGKGSTAHFVWRCGLCKRESSAKFEPGEKPKPYSADANGQFLPFLTLDCRGLEFIGFDPRVRYTLFNVTSIHSL